MTFGPLSMMNPKRKEVAICWTPPPISFVKINVNGSYKSSTGRAVCGGIVCDHMDNIVTTFHHKLGICNLLWAELWALRLGIQVAKDLGLKDISF